MNDTKAHFFLFIQVYAFRTVKNKIPFVIENYISLPFTISRKEYLIAHKNKSIIGYYNARVV